MRKLSYHPFILIACLITPSSCSRFSHTPGTNSHSQPIFLSSDPRAVYSANIDDPWNRIFRALFTRTVNARLTSDFPEAAPFVDAKIRSGSYSLRLSTKKFNRTENGDRAIEPLYPRFLTIDGPLQALSEPLFSELTTALIDAIKETKLRTAVERALMQSDVWAAYDIIFSIGTARGARVESVAEKRQQLLSLLSQFIRKLALKEDEIKSLGHNYPDAIRQKRLPDIFSPKGGWLEIELLPGRLHDVTADYRRASRVFLKPRNAQSDPIAFLEKLKRNQHLDEIEAVAIVVQNLLIDITGRVRSSPLLCDVQFRFYKNEVNTGTVSAEIRQYELSRRQLLTEPKSGGFLEFGPTSPSYLSRAGNDYDFASPIEEHGGPVVAPLRTRCTQCHGEALTHLMTYSIHYFPPVPTVRILNPLIDERARYVARRKEARSDFKSLLELW